MRDWRFILKVERKKKMHINDCLFSPIMFPSLKLENINSAQINGNISMIKQKRMNLHNRTSVLLEPIRKKPSNKIAEMKDKIIPGKSIEIRCVSAKTVKSSINKCTILTKNSSMSLKKMKRAKSAPSQRQSDVARVQVNIVIDAFDFINTIDKSINCEKMQKEKIP